MAPHSIDRPAWSQTRWLWLLLALCLIAWRVNSRVAQYHPTAPIAYTSQQAQVTFFDANERNTSSLQAVRSQSRLLAEQTDALFPVVQQDPPVAPEFRREGEDGTVLPPVYVDSVSLFSNPPPSLD